MTFIGAALISAYLEMLALRWPFKHDCVVEDSPSWHLANLATTGIGAGFLVSWPAES